MWKLTLPTHAWFLSCWFLLLQDSQPMFEMQQPSPPIPLVQPDGQFKNLPFYDAPDVLIKPTILAECNSQQFQEKFLFLFWHLNKLERDVYPWIFFFFQVVGHII